MTDPANPALKKSLMDVPVRVDVVLGELRMPIEELMAMAEGDIVALERHTDEPVDIYLSDRLMARGKLVIPVEGVPPSALADTFTQARAGGAHPHDAIDIMAARGRPVVAAADGRVEKLFWSGEGGRTLYQRSTDGKRIYYYAHHHLQ